MGSYEKNGCLVIEIGKRLDSVLAKEAEEEIRRELALHPGLPLCLDADKLQYISSSGLRVLLGLFKENQNMTVVNVSPEVYETFQITGFDTFIDIRKKKRRISVAGCRILGSGAFGTVYQLDGDTVVKAYRGGDEMLPMMEGEKEKTRQAFLSGVPTAIPFDIVQLEDGRYGAVYELIDAQNCNDIIRADPAALSRIIPQYVRFLKTLHSLQARAGQMKEAREIYLETLGKLSCLQKPVADRLRMLLEGLPEDHRLVHGDIHLKNVMISDGSMILIDMDRLSTGNPVFEFASLFSSYVAFNEDDGNDCMKFFGISRETAFRIFYDTLEQYLQPLDEARVQEAMKKAQTVGYMRFLEILAIEQEDTQSELNVRRIRHAAERLASLAFEVESLAI